MTDWISDAKTACEDAKTRKMQVGAGYKWAIVGEKYLPRALKALREKQAKDEKTEAALRAADELIPYVIGLKDRQSIPDGMAKAIAAYREARK